MIAETGSDISQDINFASLRVFKAGVLLSRPAITFNVCGDGERGLLGIRLDPSFSTNGYIYVYYTRQAASGPACAYNASTSGPRNRVSHNSAGDLAGDGQILLDNIPSDSGIHNAGDLPLRPRWRPVHQHRKRRGRRQRQPGYRFAWAGLFASARTAAGGYTVPSDNPCATNAGARRYGDTPPAGGSGPCKELCANGFRNPFRFAIQPGAGVPFVGDVGGGNWEEVDRVSKGGNYGYPIREGHCPAGVACPPNEPPDPNYINPIYGLCAWPIDEF